MADSFTGVSLFSGADGLGMGLKIAIPSLRIVAFCEREFAACEVLAARMEDGSVDVAPIFTDVQSFPGASYRGRLDILFGGSPCQDLSQAGKRVGIGGKRSGLFHEYIRVVEESQPDFIFWENVSGVLSSLTLHHRPEILGHFDEVLATAGDSPKERWYAQRHVERLHRRLLPIHGISALLYVQCCMGAVGYESETGFFTAAEVEASHKRERVFVLGWKRNLADSARRRFRELWQSSRRQGFPDGRNEGLASVNLVDASRDEWEGSVGEGRPRRGVCGAGDELGNAAGDDEQRNPMPREHGERQPFGGSGGIVSGSVCLADAGSGQLPAERWRPSGRNGPGSTGEVLRDREAVGQADAAISRCGGSENAGADRSYAPEGSRSIESEREGGSVDRVHAERTPRAPAGQRCDFNAGRESEARDRTVGHSDESGLQGRFEREYGTDKRVAGASGDSGIVGLAHADFEHDDRSGNGGPGRRGESPDERGNVANAECESISAQQWHDTGGRSGESAINGSVSGIASAKIQSVGLADAGCECNKRRGEPQVMGVARGSAEGEEDERKRCRDAIGDCLPLFAPGPGATDQWRELLVRFPWLRPAVAQAEAEPALRELADGLADLVGDRRTDALRAIGNGVVSLEAAWAFTYLARKAGLLS